MSFYLLENKPRRSQFRTSRRATPTGCIVVHTTESAPDTAGPDTGAENVANFIRNRHDAGSYHVLVDSDTIIPMVPYAYEAYQDRTGSNRFAIGISLATQAHRWASLPQDWKDKAVTNLALAACDAALWLKANHGVIVPAKRISKAESNAGKPGFISHGERDPGRRSDPGRDFPWAKFLADYDYFAKMNGLYGDPMPEAPTWQGSLVPGQFLKSGNGRYTLIHQTDGNVVLYEDLHRPVWASGTHGRESHVLVMQADGNLVLYGAGGALWASGTHGNPHSVLAVQNDGNLVIYGKGHKPLWSSK